MNNWLVEHHRQTFGKHCSLKRVIVVTQNMAYEEMEVTGLLIPKARMGLMIIPGEIGPRDPNAKQQHLSIFAVREGVNPLSRIAPIAVLPQSGNCVSVVPIDLKSAEGS